MRSSHLSLHKQTCVCLFVCALVCELVGLVVVVELRKRAFDMMACESRVF